MDFESKSRQELHAEEKVSEREIALFGQEIKDGDPLENIYSYFRLEDLEFFDVEFSGKNIDVNVFNLLDTVEKWETVSADLVELKSTLDEYRDEKAGVAYTSSSIIELRDKYVPRIKEIFKKIEAV